MKRLTWVYLTATVAAGLLFVLAGEHPAPVAAINVAALVAIALGIHRNRLPARRCWGLIAGALLAWTVSAVWISLLPSSATANEMPPALGVLFVAPFAALAFGIVALLRRQRETIPAPPRS